VVIAANEATCIYVLPRVFAEYSKLYPQVQLLVERLYGARIIEAVLENVADFGITQLPVQDRKLQVAAIYSDEIKLVARPEHVLAACATVRAEDVTPFALLLPKSGTTRARLNQWLEPVEGQLRVAMELDSTEMLKRFVLAGLGLSFLAESHCQQELREGQLRALPLAPEPMVRRLGLIYRKDKALSKAALGFIQTVLDHAGPAPCTLGA
jgi:DNA-binding transcriptional LysR family regulator